MPYVERWMMEQMRQNHWSVSEEMENSHTLFEVSSLAVENNDVE